MGKVFLIVLLMEDGMKRLRYHFLEDIRSTMQRLALETLNVIKNYYCISDFQTEDGMRKQSGEVELRYWNENLW